MQTPTLPISGAPTPNVQAFRALIRSFGLLKRVMEPHFTSIGISGAQWAILRNLYDMDASGDDAVRLSDLGNRLLVRPPSVTGVVRRLRQMGLVEVAASQADQRAKTIALTDAGRQLVETFGERHEARIEQIFAGFEPAERDQLLRLLTQLGGHLEHVAAAQDHDHPQQQLNSRMRT
jgi:DNA-binding MarR family transcriptional regulator